MRPRRFAEITTAGLVKRCGARNQERHATGASRGRSLEKALWCTVRRLVASFTRIFAVLAYAALWAADSGSAAALYWTLAVLALAVLVGGWPIALAAMLTGLTLSVVGGDAGSDQVGAAGYDDLTTLDGYLFMLSVQLAIIALCLVMRAAARRAPAPAGRAAR